MNRLIFLLGSGLLLTGTAHAQLGVRAGGGLGGITKSADEHGNATTAQRKVGYQLGVFYQVPFGKHVSLVPEVGVSYERFAVEKSYFGGEATFRSNYDQSLCYLNIPVMLRASLGAFYVEAGPQASLLVGGRATGTQTTSGGFVAGTYVTPIDAAATTSYRRFDAGPCVGVGVKLPAGLGLGLRAYWGLTKLTDEQVPGQFGQSYPGTQRRQTLQASLTYQLHGS